METATYGLGFIIGLVRFTKHLCSSSFNFIFHVLFYVVLVWIPGEGRMQGV